MKKTILKHCPACGNELVISKLKCNSCNIEISGEFVTNEFTELSATEMHFIKEFLASEGNISKLQTLIGDTYNGIKCKLNLVNSKLGIKHNSEVTEDILVNLNNKTDSAIVKCLKEKIQSCNGKSSMKMLRGEPIEIWLSRDGSGIETSGLKNVVLEWNVFDAIINQANALGGTMMRGDSAAQNGSRIGSEELPTTSIDAFISLKFYNAKEGDTVLRRSTYFSGILAWAGIVENHRSKGKGGYITVAEVYRK